jgi:hypothetical protein
MGCLLPLDFVIPYLFRRFPMGIWRTDAHVIRNAGGRASDDALSEIRGTLSRKTNCSDGLARHVRRRNRKRAMAPFSN